MAFPFLPLTFALVGMGVSAERVSAPSMDLEPSFSSAAPAAADAPSPIPEVPTEL
jgi:hypothetical protein